MGSWFQWRDVNGVVAMACTDHRLLVANIKMQMPFSKSVSRGDKRQRGSLFSSPVVIIWM